MSRPSDFTRPAARCLLGLLLAGLSCLGLPGTGNAVPVAYFGEDLGLGEGTPLPAHPNADAARVAFLGGLEGVGTESFESFAAGTGAPLSISFPGAGTATLQGNGVVEEVPVGSTNGFGRYAISGTHYWESSDVFSIAFTEPVAAFGFYGVDIGDFQGRVTLTLTNGGSVTLTIPHTVGGLGGSVLYFGFIDTEQQYTGISFGNSASGVDFFGFDDFTIGSITQVKNVVFDIHPTSCPNPINVKSKGVTPAAILGSEGFAVTEVDVSTLVLNGTVAPIRSSIEDVTAPVEDPEGCACTTAGPDGFPDLTLKFSTQALVATLGPVTEGQEVEVTIEGKLTDGTDFESSDCIVIRGANPNGSGNRRGPIGGEIASVENRSWAMVKGIYR